MNIPSEITKMFGSWPVFTTDDAFNFLSGSRKVSRKTVQVTLSRMVAGGKLYHLSKGKFSFSKSAEIAGFSYSPFYYGGAAALMIRDLIDDQVKMEVMTTKVVRKRNAKILGGTAIIMHHLPRDYYFGFNDVKYLGRTIPVSDPEKTFIDLLYFRIRLSGQDYYPLINAMDGRRLASYLKRYKKRFADRAKRFYSLTVKRVVAGKLENPY